MWLTINLRGYEVERQKLRDKKKERDRDPDIWGRRYVSRLRPGQGRLELEPKHSIAF